MKARRRALSLAGLSALASAGPGCGQAPQTAIRVHVPIDVGLRATVRSLHVQTQRCASYGVNCRAILTTELVPVNGLAEPVFALSPRSTELASDVVVIQLYGLNGATIDSEVSATNEGITRFVNGRVTDVYLGLHTPCDRRGAAPHCTDGLTCAANGACAPTEEIGPGGAGPAVDAGPEVSVDVVPDVPPLVGNCGAGSGCAEGRACFMGAGVTMNGMAECCVRPASGTCSPGSNTGCEASSCRSISYPSAGSPQLLCCTGPTAVPCGDGVCPSPQICQSTPPGDRCCAALPSTLCEGRAERDPCGTGTGACIPIDRVLRCCSIP